MPTSAPATGVIDTQLLGLPQVEQAKTDLASRLGVSANEITVVAVQSVTWPNGAMGCPQPNTAYADVLVEGLLVQLSQGGRLYNYHSGGNQAPFLCEAVGAVEKSTPFLDSDLLTPSPTGNSLS
jgi:hypothetical protein